MCRYACNPNYSHSGAHSETTISKEKEKEERGKERETKMRKRKDEKEKRVSVWKCAINRALEPDISRLKSLMCHYLCVCVCVQACVHVYVPVFCEYTEARRAQMQCWALSPVLRTVQRVTLDH